MTSQSVTNKLVANIKQANDMTTNFFTGTNVVCIDTSNRRIGIDTKTPTWSIDISGVESYNGVKCHNLDISGKADISYAVINFLKAPIISGDDVNISFIYVNELSGNLIDISEVVFNSISGDFIYSNNTISGNFIQCFSAVILNDLSINGTLTVNQFGFDNDVSFNEVNIDLSLTTQSTSNSLFQGTVDFSNSNPVTYRTISSNHINTFSISCDNLQLTQKADFSSITVSNDALFIRDISVVGAASFSNNINIDNNSLQQYIISATTTLLTNNTENIELNELQSNKIDIIGDSDSQSQISHLKIENKLDLSSNSDGTSLILPFKPPITEINRHIGNIYYNTDADGVIDGLNIRTKGDNTTITLKETSTKSCMLINNDNLDVSFNQDYYIIPIKKKYDTIDYTLNDDNYSVNVPITTSLIEINANLTLSLNNDNDGGDVDALNYEFFIFKHRHPQQGNLGHIIVNNKNTILVFDNSYNFNSTNLHYLYENSDSNNNDIAFGFSYEKPSNKDLSLNVVHFSASIKIVT